MREASRTSNSRSCRSGVWRWIALIVASALTVAWLRSHHVIDSARSIIIRSSATHTDLVVTSLQGRLTIQLQRVHYSSTGIDDGGRPDPRFSWTAKRLTFKQPDQLNGAWFAFERESSGDPRAPGAGGSNACRLRIPYYALCIPAWLAATVPISRYLRSRHRLAGGLCPACGYDVRASSERCPECGRSK